MGEKFSESVRLPEDPPLVGVPHSPEDSAFSAIAGMPESIDLCLQYREGNSASRRAVLERITNKIQTRPQMLSELFDVLMVLDGQPVYESAKLRQEIIQQLGKLKIDKFPPSQEVLAQWLTFYSEGVLYKDVAGQVLKKMVDRCQGNEKALSNFLYELTLCGLQRGGREALLKTFDILTFQTPLIPKGSTLETVVMLGQLSVDNEVLRRFMEMDSALRYVESIDSHISQIGKAHRVEAFRRAFTEAQEELEAIAAKDPERYETLLRYYTSDSLASQVQPQSSPRTGQIEFPYNLIAKGGPLQRLIVRFSAGALGEQGAGSLPVYLPQGDVNLPARYDEVVPTISASMRLPNPDHRVMQEWEELQTISFLAPREYWRSEESEQLRELNEQLRQDIIRETRYLPSPVGDIVMMDDADALALGFQSIQYEMDRIQSKRNTVVTVTVGNFGYRFVVDERLTFRDIDNREPLALPYTSAYLEHLVLAYLHALRCTGEIEVVEKGSEDGSSQFFARRAHRRILPTGHHPTQEQIAAILQMYDVSIPRLNAEAHANGIMRDVTFVMDAQGELSHLRAPLRLEAPQALDRLHALGRTQ